MTGHVQGRMQVLFAGPASEAQLFKYYFYCLSQQPSSWWRRLRLAVAEYPAQVTA